MKNKNIKKLISVFAIGICSVLLSSCLEDTGYLNVFNGENKDIAVVSIGQAEHGRNVKTVEIKTTPQDLAVIINIARASSDVAVTVSVDAAALTKYNDEQLAIDPAFIAFKLLPATTYTIPSATVTIPQGTLDMPFIVKLTSSNVSLAESYMLPLTITSVDKSDVVIASNMKTSLVAVVVKNRFDGKYTVNGTMVDNVNSTLTGYYPWKASLVTNGALQNVLQDEEGYFADPKIHIIKSGTAVSGYGTFAVTFNFDASNNVVSVINLFGQPAGNTRSAQLDPTGINKWDPVTKTLRVKYFMIQTNQSTGTGPRVKFDETYTYTGPR